MFLLADAIKAKPTTGNPIEGNPITDSYCVDVRANGDYFTCSFVTEYAR
tara:strand:+ start:263 stop:409 length:147 start_codon:yes stop_codon:yes gene_type:complete